MQNGEIVLEFAIFNSSLLKIAESCFLEAYKSYELREFLKSKPLYQATLVYFSPGVGEG